MIYLAAITRGWDTTYQITGGLDRQAPALDDDGESGALALQAEAA